MSRRRIKRTSKERDALSSILKVQSEETGTIIKCVRRSTGSDRAARQTSKAKRQSIGGRDLLLLQFCRRLLWYGIVAAVIEAQ
ncbi:hypothetical protein ACTXT7_006471 [Hymenolepis weldensis]